MFLPQTQICLMLLSFNLWYFKLRLFDLTDQRLNIKGLRHRVAKLYIYVVIKSLEFVAKTHFLYQ